MTSRHQNKVEWSADFWEQVSAAVEEQTALVDHYLQSIDESSAARFRWFRPPRRRGQTLVFRAAVVVMVALAALALTVRPGTEPVGSVWIEWHVPGVQAIAVLPGPRLVAGTTSNQVSIRGLQSSGEPIALDLHDAPVNAIAVLSDGRVASGSADGTVKVWDADSAHPARETPIVFDRHDRNVTAVADLPDGRVVSGDGGGTVLVWDPDHPEAQPLTLRGHRGPILAVGAVADGRIVSAGGDGRVLVWAGETPRTLAERATTTNAAVGLASGRVVIAGSDGMVQVLDPDRTDAEPVEQLDVRAPVRDVAELADGRIVVVAGDGRVLLWETSAPDAAPLLLAEHHAPVLRVAALPDGRHVASVSADGDIVVSELPT